MVAHEVAHIKCEHGVWITAANALALGLYSIGGGLGRMLGDRIQGRCGMKRVDLSVWICARLPDLTNLTNTNQTQQQPQPQACSSRGCAPPSSPATAGRSS